MIYGRIYGFCLTRFGYCPPPPLTPLHSRHLRFSTYGQTDDVDESLGLVLTRFSDPTALSRLAAFRGAPNELFRLLPANPKSSKDFSEFRLGNPAYSMQTFVVILCVYVSRWSRSGSGWCCCHNLRELPYTRQFWTMFQRAETMM